MDETSRTRFLTLLELRVARYLSHDQLDVIPLLLGLDVPFLPQGKRAKARAVAAAAEEAGRLEELIDQLRELRPRVRWPAVPQGRPETAEAAAPVTVYQIGEVNTGGGAFFGGQVTAGGDVTGGADSSHTHTSKE